MYLLQQIPDDIGDVDGTDRRAGLSAYFVMAESAVTCDTCYFALDFSALETHFCVYIVSICITYPQILQGEPLCVVWLRLYSLHYCP